MNIKRFAFVVVVLAACASIAGASCVVRKRAVFAQAAVVQQAVIAPVAVPIAAYGAVYDDGAATQNLIRDLTKRIADLEARVAIAETKLGNLPGPVPPPQPLPPAPKANDKKPAAEAKAAPKPVLAIPALYARSCVRCHQQGVKESGGLALVDSTGKKLMPLEGKELKAMLRRINLPATDPKVMPPQKGNVPEDVKHVATDEEAAEVLDVLTRD